METVIDATIPTDRFVLEDTLKAVPDVEVEFVRLAIHSSSCAVPYVRASTSQPDRLDTALQEDPSTERVRCLSGGDGRRLYSVDWTKRAARRIEGFAESGGAVRSLRGTSDRWVVQALFSDRASASETFQTWRDEEISPSLSCIGKNPHGSETPRELSPVQYDTIERAFQTDYYEIPRGTTLGALATELGVSHQALSERLRRGHSHLVERLLSESTTRPKRRL